MGIYSAIYNPLFRIVARLFPFTHWPRERSTPLGRQAAPARAREVSESLGSCGDQQLSGSALYWLGTCATGPVGLPPSFAIYLRWWFSKHGNVRVMGSVAQWGLRCPHTLRGLVILSQHADNWGHPLGRAFAPPAGVPITANALVITSRGSWSLVCDQAVPG